MSKPSRRPSRARQSAGTASPIAESSRRTRSGSTTTAVPDASRRARRERARVTTAQPSFVMRYRWPLVIGVVVILGVVGVGYVLASGTKAAAYTCGTELPPAAAAPASPGASPVLGQAAPDQGRIHVPVSDTAQFYASCPPASGPHYAQPDAPIPTRFYGPDEDIRPMHWIHNLEHGGMAILYNCSNGCDQGVEDALKAFQASVSPSPLCGIPNNVVVARFDQMAAPIAAVTWDRVLFQQKVDTQQLQTFFTQNADRGPEAQCAAAPGSQSAPPSAGGSSGSSAPVSPSAAPSAS